MNSRERFEEIRYQVQAIAKAEAELAAIRKTCEVKTQRYTASVQGGSHDHMAKVDAIIEKEKALDLARAKANHEIDAALEILYGSDGRGGVARDKGSAYADAVCSVYLMGNTHKETADELGCTRSWVTNLCTATFRHIDRRMR